MRITAVTTWFPTAVAPSRGSFVVRDLAAIAALHDVRLIHLVPPCDDDGSRHLVHDGIPVLRIPMAPANPASVAGAARALRPALTGTQLVHTMAFSSLLPLVLRRLAAPWVHTEHWSALTTPATLPRQAQIALPVLTQILSRPDVVTSVCDFLAAPIRHVRGERPTRVVPCIVEPYPPVPRRDRSEGGPGLRLVSTGGLIDRKDPLLALEIVAELRHRGVDAHLTWVGEGPLREAATQRASHPDLAGHIDLAGTRDAAWVREALAGADMFLGPTKADNFFVSAAEAIVAGRPVVVGSTGGQGEYLTPATARLVETREPADWADAVVELDELSRDTSAEAIAATIGDAFSTPVVAAGYNAAYRAALGGWARP